jgi:hypothetical protein
LGWCTWASGRRHLDSDCSGRVFEKKIVKKTYTLIKEGGRWRLRINKEIMDILQWADIVKCIKWLWMCLNDG